MVLFINLIKFFSLNVDDIFGLVFVVQFVVVVMNNCLSIVIVFVFKGVFDDFDDDFEGFEDVKEGFVDDDFVNIFWFGFDDFNFVFDSSLLLSQFKSDLVVISGVFGGESSFDFVLLLIILVVNSMVGFVFVLGFGKVKGDVYDWDVIFVGLDEIFIVLLVMLVSGNENVKEVLVRLVVGRMLMEEGEYDDLILKNFMSMGYFWMDVLVVLEKYDNNLERVSSKIKNGFFFQSRRVRM